MPLAEQVKGLTESAINDLTPDAIEVASLEELQGEVARYQGRLQQSIQELVSCAAKNGSSEIQ